MLNKIWLMGILGVILITGFLSFRDALIEQGRRIERDQYSAESNRLLEEALKNKKLAHEKAFQRQTEFWQRKLSNEQKKKRNIEMVETIIHLPGSVGLCFDDEWLQASSDILASTRD